MTPSRLTTARHFDPDFEPRSRDLPGSAQPLCPILVYRHCDGTCDTAERHSDVASAASSVSATGDINIAFAYFVSQSIRKTYTKPSESHEAQLKVEQTAIMNVGRSLSIRSKKSDNTSSHASSGGAKHHFGLSSLRGVQQPELSKRLYKLIKSQNHAISAYDQAGKESAAIASQLSDWGESTEDESLSDISDKLGVLLAEIAEQEDLFAQGLEESRGVLKQIRNTESSVQPSRTHKQKIQDEIQKLKYKEPESTKLVTLEQELVRAEAQSLVAEAQLTNITRQKFKEAYDVHTAAVIERAEKQILLAQQARRLVNLLDDTPIVPGEERPAYTAGEQAREVLNDAETGLRGWQARNDPVHSQAGRMGVNAMPGHQEGGVQNVAPPQTEHLSNEQRVEAMERAQEQAPSAPYPVAEEERVATAV